jgi:hypothetical protein
MWRRVAARRGIVLVSIIRTHPGARKDPLLHVPVAQYIYKAHPWSCMVSSPMLASLPSTSSLLVLKHIAQAFSVTSLLRSIMSAFEFDNWEQLAVRWPLRKQEALGIARQLESLRKEVDYDPPGHPFWTAVHTALSARIVDWNVFSTNASAVCQVGHKPEAAAIYRGACQTGIKTFHKEFCLECNSVSGIAGPASELQQELSRHAESMPSSNPLVSALKSIEHPPKGLRPLSDKTRNEAKEVREKLEEFIRIFCHVPFGEDLMVSSDVLTLLHTADTSGQISQPSTRPTSPAVSVRSNTSNGTAPSDIE